MMKKRNFAGWYAVICTGLVNAVLLLALANVLLALRERESEGPERTSTSLVRKYGTNVLQSAYPDLAWQEIQDLLVETWDRRPMFEYAPLTQFREKPFAGRYVNVDSNGYRRTENQGPWPPDFSAFNVFLLGGSTAFGYGVSDGETLASHLQRSLAEKVGKRVRVYNFGRGFYHSTLERLLLEELLLQSNPPDLAVFVDGINECNDSGGHPLLSAQLAKCFATTGTDGADRCFIEWIRCQPLTRWLHGRMELAGPEADLPPPKASQPPNPEKRRATRIERYLRNKAMIESLCGTFHVPVLFVWQPSPYYKYDLRYHPFALRGDLGTEAQRYARVYAQMAEWAKNHPKETNFLWCADLQEDVREPLYVDNVHYSPRLNRMLAETIAAAVAQRVRPASE